MDSKGSVYSTILTKGLLKCQMYSSGINVTIKCSIKVQLHLICSCFYTSITKALKNSLILSVCEKHYLDPSGPSSESSTTEKDFISRRFLSKSCAPARFTRKYSQAYTPIPPDKSLPSLFAQRSYKSNFKYQYCPSVVLKGKNGFSLNLGN